MRGANYLRAQAELCLKLARQMSDQSAAENPRVEAARHHAEAAAIEAEQSGSKAISQEAEAGMHGDPKTNEWSLLKDQFDALVHDESMREDSIERFCDDQIRRRFAEWINRAAERKSLNRAC